MSNMNLQKAYDEYHGKLKALCLQLNENAFINDAMSPDFVTKHEDEDSDEPVVKPFLFRQSKPSFLDFTLYHELVNAMLVANIGKRNVLFGDDKRIRNKMKDLGEWYFKMSL